MKIHHLTLLFTLSSIIFSCSNTEKPTENSDTAKDTIAEKVSINELMMEYNALKDSANFHWAVLDSINDEIVLSMNRLLDEISYNTKHDAAKLKTLKAEVEKLKNKKLKQVQLVEKDNIDIYDNLVTQTADDVIAFAKETPDMMEKYPLSETLIDEIIELNNNSIALKRSDYDDHAFYFNQFIKKNGEQLKGSGQDISLYPTFSEIIIEEQANPNVDIWEEEQGDTTDGNEPLNIEM